MAMPHEVADARPVVLVALEGSLLLAGLLAAIEQDYRVITCARALAAARQRELRAGVVVIDVEAAPRDVATTCRRVRAGSPAAIVAVGSATNEADLSRALDAGADDYVAAPFGGGELAARIRALLRRTPASDNAHIVVGRLTIDMARHAVLLGERELRLTGTEFRLLELLARHPGRVVPREDLLHHVGTSAADGTRRQLRVAMSRLRTKIRDDSPGDIAIDAIAGIGYRLSVRDES